MTGFVGGSEEQIPPLRCGMTTKRQRQDNDNGKNKNKDNGGGQKQGLSTAFHPSEKDGSPGDSGSLRSGDEGL
jgi:hypothetical protein